jgi:hypothetical protein
LFKRAGEAKGLGRSPGSPSPTDLERFGRSVYDPVENRWPWPSAWSDFIAPIYQLYQVNPDGFLVSLASLAEETGGWSAYGAERLMIEVAGGDLPHPAYGRIMDAALNFLRSNGVPPKMVTGHEWTHWLDSGGTVDTWVPRRPPPTEDDAPISELQVGQTRRLAQLSGDPESNVFLVQRAQDGRYCWMIDSKASDDDPRRTQWVYRTSEALHELYIQIGLNLQVPPHWYDSELELYFPLPIPTL